MWHWVYRTLFFVFMIIPTVGYISILYPTFTLQKKSDHKLLQPYQQLKSFHNDEQPSVELDTTEQITNLNHNSDSEAFEHIRQLVFAGGGGRGFAYFPALQVSVNQYGLDLTKVHSAAGTSAGSIAALMSLITDDIELLEKIYIDIPSKNFRDFSWTNLLFFVSELGLYEGDELRNWLVSTIFNHTGLIDPSFAELYEHNHKVLKIYGTNLTKGQLVEFSHINTPNESVVRSILISCALPIAFKPRTNQNGDFLVDGGLIKNHPIDAFDYYDGNETRFANPSTLGFYAKSAHEYTNERSPKDGVVNYLEAIFSAIVHHESNSFSKVDLNRTVIIDCPKQLSLTRMKLKQANMDLIYERCEKSLEDFIKSYEHKREYPGHWAVTKGYGSALCQICKNGSYQDHIDEQGENLLMKSVRLQRRDIVQILIENGADLCYRNFNHESVYQISLQAQSSEGIRTLLSHALAERLSQALERKDIDDAVKLINSGADLQYMSAQSDITMIEKLVRDSQYVVLKELYQQGVKLPFNGRVIRSAIIHSNYQTKMFLLDAILHQVIRHLPWI